MADIKIFAQDIDVGAAEQVALLGTLPPFEHARIRIMPDAHLGKGCVIGFTASMTDAVIPNVVGVDVGCGVYAARLDEELSDGLLHRLDRAAHESVPSGTSVHSRTQIGVEELAAYACSPAFHDRGHLRSSLGTLGGGNHFIELDVTAPGELWLVVHTGSRGIGAQLAAYWQRVAADQRRGNTRAQRDELIARLVEQGRQREISVALKALETASGTADDQAWLEGAERDAYLHDMGLAQAFAARNRRRIVEIMSESAGVRLAGEEVESVHNYIDLDSGIIRKGAISAQAGQRVIVPLNMAAGCVLGRGLGNEDWNCSAPHGAGRAMSRRDARAALSMDDFRLQMTGVYTTSVCAATLDEAPMAYKDAGSIVSQLAPSVAVDCVMRPVWNFKATS